MDEKRFSSISQDNLSISVKSFSPPLKRVPFIDKGATFKIRFFVPYFSNSILTLSVKRHSDALEAALYAGTYPKITAVFDAGLNVILNTHHDSFETDLGNAAKDKEAFEKDSTINGIKTKGETMQNMAPQSNTGNAGDMMAVEAMAVKHTPPLKNAPTETRITAQPVASERKVVINLAETEVSLRDIEGTTLNITMSEVHDLNGNMSNPIKWTAYVKQNTLLWGKDSVKRTTPSM